MRFGANLLGLAGLGLERGADAMAHATLLDVLAARFEFVQGRVARVGGGAVGAQQCRLLSYVCYAYDLAVETHEQVLGCEEAEGLLAEVERYGSGELGGVEN